MIAQEACREGSARVASTEILECEGLAVSRLQLELGILFSNQLDGWILFLARPAAEDAAKCAPQQVAQPVGSALRFVGSRLRGITAAGVVRFHRIASLNEAIASAIADLRVCGLEVERIEIDPQDVLDAASATA